MLKPLSTRKHPVSDITYHTPFSVSKDGLYVIDRLGYVVAKFQRNEYIGAVPAAQAVANAFN